MADLTNPGFLLIAAAIGGTSVSLFGAQVAFDIAALLWLIVVKRRFERES